MPQALTFALQLLSQVPALISAGQEVVKQIEATTASIQNMKDENRDPTPEEWDQLNTLVETLRAQRPDVG